jgi:cytoskeletal protein RodZ
MSKGTFGDCLKREREMRDVSLEEICSATRISTRFLEALEKEDWEKLPGGVFNRGFVRSVARYLGLDEENMLTEYDLARLNSGAVISAHAPQSIPRTFPKWFPIAFGLLLAGLIAGAFHAWRVFATHRTVRSNTSPARGSTPVLDQTSETGRIPAQSVSASETSTAPNSSSSTSSDTSSGSPLKLSIAAGKSTQLQVLADGRTLFDTVINAGENQHFQARDEFHVSVGDSGGVLLELNGQTIPPLGTPGSPGKISLTRKDLKKADSGTD